MHTLNRSRHDVVIVGHESPGRPPPILLARPGDVW